MEVITLNGREFVRASKAAREVGYTSDYVGQLCRSRAIAAERVGRSWYVDREELREHKTEKRRSARTKAREHVRKVIADKSDKKIEKEFTGVSANKKQGFEHRYLSHANTQYKADDRPLMPEIKKMANNKDYSDYIVDDVPTIPVADEQGNPNEDSYESTNITIKRHNASSVRREKTLTTEGNKLRKAPSVQVQEVQPVDMYDEESVIGRQKNKRVHGHIVLLGGALLLSLCTLTTAFQLSVVVANSSGTTLNQMTSGYAIDPSIMLSKSGL